MAHRVKTSIDLCQNNLLNGGFERVIALPLENNVLGRQVLYQGKPYWWNGTEWISWTEIDPNQFWQTDKANAEFSPISANVTPGTSFITFLQEADVDALKRSRQFLVFFRTAIADRVHTNFIDDTKYLLDNVRYQFIAEVELNITDIPFTVSFPVSDSGGNPIVATNLIVKGEGIGVPYYEFTFTGRCIVNIIKVRAVTYVTIDSNADITLATPNDEALTTFINDNNVTQSYEHNSFSLLSLLSTLINKLNQGGGGATGFFWSLTQANAETSACEVTINNSNESIFPKVLASYGDYIHSRNIVVDLSNFSDESSYVFDLFGDISNVPTGVRYSIFITGYNNSLKLDFPKQYLTNISAIHTPDGAHEESYTIAYSSATKIDFVKLGANKVWVDVSNKM